MTSNFSVKIGDYGLARTLHPQDYLSSDPSTTSNHALEVNSENSLQYLPLRWLAPEVRQRMLNEGRSFTPTLKCASENIWGLGVTLWEVATIAQKVPFSSIEDFNFLHAALISPGPNLDRIDILKVLCTTIVVFSISI